MMPITGFRTFGRMGPDPLAGCPEAQTASDLRVLRMAWVEAENTSTFDQNELTLAIGPPRHVSLVRPYFLRQRRVSGGCLGLFILLLLRAAIGRHRLPPFRDSIPSGQLRIS